MKSIASDRAQHPDVRRNRLIAMKRGRCRPVTPVVPPIDLRSEVVHIQDEFSNFIQRFTVSDTVIGTTSSRAATRLEAMQPLGSIEAVAFPMLNEPGQGDSGPRQCSSCGARLEGPLNFCPNCGASQLGTSFRETMRAERPYDERETHHERLYLYTFCTLAVFALVFAGYVLSHRNARVPEARVVQGAVSVPMPLPETSTASPGLRDERAAMKREVSVRADVVRNLAIARASLDKNDLGPTRRAITTALAEQPGNGAALAMRAELVSREQERDSLLGYARLCARQADWVCAWHNAGHVLTIDASNSEARDLLARAMAEQSAKGEREFDPSLDTQ